MLVIVNKKKKKKKSFASFMLMLSSSTIPKPKFWGVNALGQAHVQMYNDASGISLAQVLPVTVDKLLHPFAI